MTCNELVVDEKPNVRINYQQGLKTKGKMAVYQSESGQVTGDEKFHCHKYENHTVMRPLNRTQYKTYFQPQKVISVIRLQVHVLLCHAFS